MGVFLGAQNGVEPEGLECQDRWEGKDYCSVGFACVNHGRGEPSKVRRTV